ncbi:hypothetical protein BD309DRAFT_89842 [Dichomitus squalens]|uniref:Uncharacterized protein n=1 Tax=Dichomitus squalens TaxID=114155 RepID=A0A4Q9PL01_9APHY|nr:hypothetical protein BD311DRAFT_524575 [Dichomitus squalens]TBU43671.1 hypothetical protein BD309DRAFT_89842 [Dichomitus squalens]TBU54853.1 hypothetical protein BD310DRAFT_726199 [Dichomitus squalens]
MACISPRQITGSVGGKELAIRLGLNFVGPSRYSLCVALHHTMTTAQSLGMQGDYERDASIGDPDASGAHPTGRRNAPGRE